MRRWLACLVVLATAFPLSAGHAADESRQPSYTFTINGQPLLPRIVSLHGDSEHPRPGDLIAIDELLLTLGPERDCHFLIESEKDDPFHFSKVFLRLADGRRRVVGVRVYYANPMERKPPIVDPLGGLSADESRGLWGVHLDAWSKELAREVQRLDLGRTCIAVASDVREPNGEKTAFPRLPRDLHYLAAEGWGDDNPFGNDDVLRRFTQLRFLSISGSPSTTFDARWLTKCRQLCRLDLTNHMIEHAEALSQLDQIECLNLSGVRNLADADFAEKLTKLKSLDLADTAIWSLYGLANHPSLARLDVSRTKVRDVPGTWAENVESLDVSDTMVRDLSPLGKAKGLATITASNSTVEKLPRRPMPSLRNLTVFSTPLSRASIRAFAKLNPKCAVFTQWTDALRQATTEATRLRIRTKGPGRVANYAGYPFLPPAKTLSEITDPTKIREFVRLMKIDEKQSDNGCWDGCCLEGGPTLEFYQKDQLIAVVGCTNIGLSWGRHWPMSNARLTPSSLERLSQWLVESHYYDAFAPIRQRLAVEKAEADEHAAIVKCYPKHATKFFERMRGDEDQDDEDRNDADDHHRLLDKPSQLAKAVGDPVALAVATCRAVGAFHAKSPWKNGDPWLVVEACRNIDDADFLKALGKIRGDRQAELGAARLCFEEETYRTKIPASERLDFMLRFAAVLLD